MKPQRVLVPLIRLAFLAFCVLTSGYCLLAYVPFTYTQFIEARLLGWTSAFADLHAWLYWIVLALLATTMDRGGRAPRALLLVLAAAGAALVAHPILPRIASNTTALLWALAALVPLAAIGVVDLLRHTRAVSWGKADRADDLRLLAVTLGSSLFLAVLNMALHLGRLGGAGPGETAVVALSSVTAHLLVFFSALQAVLLLARGIAGFSSVPARGELILGTLLLAAALSAAVGRIVFPALSVSGAPAIAYAGTFGVAVALFLAGLAVRVGHLEPDRTVRSGFDLLVAPLGPPAGSRIAAVAYLAAIVGTAFALASSTATLDWNHLLRRLTALAIWPFAFAWMDAVLPRWHARRATQPVLVLVSCLASVGLFRATHPAAADPGSPLARYAEHDGSYGAIRDALSHGKQAAADEGGFFDFLQKHTNIPRSIRIAPVDVELAPSLAPTATRKPNIFLFVIDSLRQDYLSPYNPAVGFTPEIGRFGRDAVVFRNAFTHYGSTGLSEPAIWAGGLLVHQQYVTPFHPMNSLEKLVQAEGYRSLVSMDSILRVLLASSPSLSDLDEGVPGKDYTFCRSLEALRGKTAQDRADAPPLFVYTQPQDIHVSTITREGASVPAGETYPGFYAPYASRIRRMDACLGAFLRDLEARGLYDESLIVLTSDHGDSLGEGGRWGHAYTLYPKIVRVPLLMKLPKSMATTFRADDKAVTFTTDITPSLYELLSHPPSLRGGLFGRPLFTRGGAAAPPRPDGWLLAASYGPVYGLLEGDGRALYVVDAINYEDWYFDMTAGHGGEQRPVTERLRRERRLEIRSAISSLHDLYRTGDLD